MTQKTLPSSIDSRRTSSIVSSRLLAHQVDIPRGYSFSFESLIFVEAWLVTNGYNVGIVQVVGQAIKKAALTDRRNKLVAIGVCKWGSVKNIEQLTVDPPVRNDQAERELVGEDKGKGRRGERDLEINHTHYLMLDDGRLRYCDTEDYRTDLCLQIAKYHDEHSFPSE